MTLGHDKTGGLFQGIPGIYLLLLCDVIKQFGLNEQDILFDMGVSRSDLLQPDSRITMKMDIRQDVLNIEIDDTAPPSLPSSWSSNGREAHEGGLGLNMINSIASEVRFTPTADGNHASLTFDPD